MNLQDKTIVITGAASGIGRAMAIRFAAEGAKWIICADLNMAGAEETAAMVGDTGLAFKCNVAQEADIIDLIETVEAGYGAIDLFCSNAGIGVGRGPETPDEDWYRIIDINVMAHIWAARHLVPKMIERGGGYFLNTASAAGLLSQIGSMPYAVTKHAAVGAAEWLALTYGDQGIKVSCLCPQAVKTEMTKGHEDGVAAIDGMMEPEPVAEACVAAIRDETFLVLPHEQVLGYMRAKTADYDRWIGGMRKLNRRYEL